MYGLYILICAILLIDLPAGQGLFIFFLYLVYKKQTGK